MAEPAKKPIRLTFFWSDEAAVVQDFNKNHSKKMVEWAKEFFDRYGFELDVVPDPGGPIKEAYRYALAKSGGYEPDLDSYEQVLEAWKKVRMKPREDFELAEDDLKNLRIAEEARRLEINATRTLLSGIPAGNTAEREEVRTRLDGLLDSYVAINESIAQLEPKVKKFKEKLDNVDLIFDEDFEQRNFDLVPRKALGGKIASSLPFSAGTRIKLTDENVKVWDPSRLKVLHTRFKPIKAPLMTLDPPSQPFGVTRRAINFNQRNNDYVWDGPFIMINTNRHEDITLAHEIVHAAGRGHRPIFRKKTLSEFARTITMDPSGKLQMPSRLVYQEYAAYQDGPNNDIMNYNAKGKKPADIILQDGDKDDLETRAFFVIPPKPNP